MPPTKPKTGLMAKIKNPEKKSPIGPLWKGPEAEGGLGGVTQSMLSAFLVCRERFRLKYVEGLKPSEGFSNRLEYGQMWHTCEEAHAKGVEWRPALEAYCQTLFPKYPLQRQEVEKWWSVCTMQFPIYVDYWSTHQDVVDRTPLLQEKVFDVPYRLPSGRTVRLRGKFDAVDLIGKKRAAGIWLGENKSKGRIEEEQLRRQLTFDLQTMMYLVALREFKNNNFDPDGDWNHDIKGVRYNVIRRPLSGGKGQIVQKQGSKNVAPETADEYYRRLQQYFIDDPAYFFMRWNVDISPHEVGSFEDRFLKPLLEQLCEWYQWIIYSKGNPFKSIDPTEYHEGKGWTGGWGLHWQHPFGVYNVMNEGGASDFDAYLSTGNSAGLTRRVKLFEELQ